MEGARLCRNGEAAHGVASNQVVGGAREDQELSQPTADAAFAFGDKSMRMAAGNGAENAMFAGRIAGYPAEPSI
jgi:hypothetical protein